MDQFLSIARNLAEANIGFTVHYPGKNSAVFTIKESMNNEQLTRVVALGGSLALDGVVQILVLSLGKKED